jgi:hypothetical protein
MLWLAIFVTCLGWLLTNAASQVRQEAQIRTLLLTVQSALQDYHVDQERYIPREKLTGSEIITVLADFEFLSDLPINPWSGVEWKLDGEEPDFLVYETDPNFETYALKAIHPKSGKVTVELDSEENPSLE